jgi:hypothetical protein
MRHASDARIRLRTNLRNGGFARGRESCIYLVAFDEPLGQIEINPNVSEQNTKMIPWATGSPARDLRGVEHTIEVNAQSLYEAVAQGFACSAKTIGAKIQVEPGAGVLARPGHAIAVLSLRNSLGTRRMWPTAHLVRVSCCSDGFSVVSLLKMTFQFE